MYLLFLCRSLRKMAVGMILACLAFAVAAVVEIKINVS
jgi:oligopeptide transporter 2